MEQQKLFQEQKIFQEDDPQKEYKEWSKRLTGIPLNKLKPKKTFRSKEEYYKSEEWERVRVYALHRTGKRCQKCGVRGA